MDLSMLNEEQHLAVVTTEGPVLILAGAGSGKTRVLTHRIAHLIEDKRIFPSNILAFTFTNKASKEMINRVERLIGPVSGAMWMGTFHSIAVKMLRRDADLIGYGKDFIIYDSDDQLTVIKQAVKKHEIDDKRLPARAIQAQISQAKNELMDPDEYLVKSGKDYITQAVAKVYRTYQETLVRNNAMDFDDLLIQVIRLLEKSEEVRTYYQKKFQYIHVDEYQDTNKVQYKLIRMLAAHHGNVCVVGDIDQSIYGWRGADIRNIRDFEKDFDNAKFIKLEQNYRSTQLILDAANGVIQNNSDRKEKTLWTLKTQGESIKYYRAASEYDEARFIAEEIERLTGGQNRNYSDFAILYRTNAQSRAIEEGLLKFGISYNIVGGYKFYERLEIKNIMAYLRLVQNPRDEVSFARMINVPKRGIGAKSIESILELCQTRGLNTLEAAMVAVDERLVTAKAAEGVCNFISGLMPFIQNKEEMRVSEIIETIGDKMGYVAELKAENTIESTTRLENIKELLTVAQQFEVRSDEPTLETFLAEVSLMSDIDGIKDTEDLVTLMTLHSAKGLEYPVVFLTGLEEQIFPTSRAIDGDGDLEEERRLAYVGITRAEEILYITNAYARMLYGRTAANAPSRFISEIPVDLIMPLNEEKQMGYQRKYNKFSDDLYEGNNPNYSKPFPGKGGFSAAAQPVTKPLSDSSELSLGSKVKHKIFGEGTVITIKEDKGNQVATVAFKNKGIKQLVLGIAPLEVIES
jgi:DNA helicase-2/ATP-dependent DNA helicase PcrA